MGQVVIGTLFRIEEQADALIVIPITDLRALAFQEIETDTAKLLTVLQDSCCRHVVIDFQQTSYFGSVALSLLVKIWKRVHIRGGRLVFCNVSEHEREELHATHLDRLWPICVSRAEALQAVQSSPPSSAPGE